MNTVVIDESALESMESLLGEQFSDTLVFCCAEFERLAAETLNTLGQDLEASIRHAHSLKSNASQFGATSLSDVAREIEHSLNNGEQAKAIEASKQLEQQVSGSKEALTNWLASR
ncbi:Hpt domain-containing protein [Pseudoalteromonas shioyasakiensis]|uniref:Hpt domain-containing protein n=1 Tax=Pseudoalteromonas shioyasakiensis TaxID=1190813 RepID=UPI0021180E52|nr:Hpt domain-containing protein [Pseudoalteromonas shioyasakiensis]MCQ8876958.1 Hpt domain-containing protein [Pseudoalteromonas shioyasakiensis]